jgi:cysteinyl-tRNA synthetase
MEKYNLALCNVVRVKNRFGDEKVLRFFNTLTRKKEKFVPLEKPIVKMYNCGLTVYDYAHIGNLRAFMVADLLRRYLEYKGFQVKQVMNFTDVGHMFEDVDIGEDKLEAAAKKERKDPWTIADFYIKAFLEDVQKMNFREPMVRPRATEHIEEMIELIEKLVEKGYAYIVNGSVYFDVAKFGDYGKLSGNTVEKLEIGAGGRIEFNPEKRNQFDFALWINDPRHVMNWRSPWGEKGYPGWHIECSAMAIKYLGETIDIHTGGVDNIFPHHENEIAQSEAATGKRFANCWLHVEYLLVDGGKMSKSLGNFYTLKDLIAKGHDPKSVRYLLLATHYRQQLDFTFEGLKAAEKAVERLTLFNQRLTEINGETAGEELKNLLKATKRDFEVAMDNDLNITEALATMFDFVRDVNKMIDQGKVSRGEARAVHDLMMQFDKILAVIGEAKKKLLPKEIEELIQKREEARKVKDWKTADEIRQKLFDKGIILEDTATGVKWRRKS